MSKAGPPDPKTEQPGPPSPLVTSQWSELQRAAATGPIVDLACGRGRHALWLSQRKIETIALDRNARFLEALCPNPGDAAIHRIRCDFEIDAGLPLAPGRCGAILVFRYLHRPLANAIQDALAPGGLLLYETFTVEQRKLGTGPRRAEFLLDSGELPTLFPRLEILLHDEGLRGPEPAHTARLVARAPGGTGALASTR